MTLLATDQMSNGASSCSDMNAPTKVIFTAGMLSIVGSSVILTAAKVIENSPVVMPMGLAMFSDRSGLDHRRWLSGTVHAKEELLQVRRRP